jgi:hypothetical protein
MQEELGVVACQRDDVGETEARLAKRSSISRTGIGITDSRSSRLDYGTFPMTRRASLSGDAAERLADG